MTPEPHGPRRGSPTDDGFTLVEVIVALSLLALLSTAALYFFVSGTRTVTHQQRSHGAVSAANDAMEQAFSYVPQMAGSTAATTSSGLLVGRLDTDVTAAWTAAAAAGVAGVADTYPAWDRATSPAPLAGIGDDRVKQSRTVRSSGIEYDVTTLIGYCYRVSTNPSGACTRIGGDSIGNPNAGYVRMLRAIVVVRWPGTTQSCTGGTCTYQIQSLIDPNSDIRWNNTTRLQAADDSVAVNAGESVTIDVLANDAMPEITSNPLSLVTQPSKAGVQVGTAVVNTSAGKIVYNAPLDGHGEVTFVYRASLGARNVQATVHVYITPQAPELSANVLVNQSVEIPVQAVGGGTPTELTITQHPTGGTLSVLSGPARFRFQAGPGAGSREFRYTYKDAEGMTSLVGIGRVTVTTYAPGTAPSLQYPRTGTWPAQTSPAARTLDVRADSGNPTGYRTIVTSAPTGGTITNAPVGTPVAGALTWAQPANAAGAYTFTYQVVAPDGSNPSPDGTVTVLVPPVAQDRSISIRRSTSSATNGTVTLTGIPGSGLTFTRTSNPTCATPLSPASSASQVLQVPKNASRTTCTFRYTTSVTTPVGVLTSAPATVTVTVTS